MASNRSSLKAKLAIVLAPLLLCACSGGGGTAAPSPDPAPRLERFVGSIAAAEGPVGTPLEYFLAGDIAADRNGTLYVAYGDNAHRITPSGEVTRLASTLFLVGGVAVDEAGNVYVGVTTPGSSRGGYIPPVGRIHRISPLGAEMDLPLLPGSDGTDPNLLYVGGLAADAGGSLYIGDIVARQVRRRAPDGTVTTVAGVFGVSGGSDGPAGAATFNGPVDLAVDAARNTFVADAGNHVIRRISPDGVVSTYAGRIGIAGHADGPAANATFDYPNGIALDPGGNLYVAELHNHAIRKITPAGIVSTVVGSPGVQGFVPGPLPGVINSPHGVAIVGSDLYITMLTGVAVVRNRP